MNAGELLANTLSPDQATREDATNKLESASRENYPAYMLMLSAELVNENSQVFTRNAAGLALKNALTARESSRQTEFSSRWLAVDNDTRSKIKQDVLMALHSPSSKVGIVAAQGVAAIANVELPVGQWPELIEILLGFVNNAANTPLRIATLNAIGYICESIDPDVLAVRANEILTAVVHGARKDEPSPEVQLAAIQALYNSLSFIRDNFEREGERNYIMQVVCEATQNPSIPVQVAAFECLVRIMNLYYDKMAFYMERALFGLTVMGMKSSEEQVALQAIEFWTAVAEDETNMESEWQEAQDGLIDAEIEEPKYFSRIALPEIIPVILMLLTRQDEDADEDEWNVAMAAGTCLNWLAQAVHDPIVPAVISFIEANIKSQDWHQREAAVMAFGAILVGPDPSVLTPLVNQALPILIDMMSDSNVHVKDTTAWTLGRICEVLLQCIKPDVHLHPLVSALVNGLSDSPRIIANCCWALQQLVEGLTIAYGDEEGATGLLSPYFEGTVTALMRVTETAGNESNFRTAAYEAITSFVTNATADVKGVVENVIMTTLNRMDHLLGVQNQILGMDDRNNWNDLQSNLCSVTVSVVRKLNEGILPLADQIMTLVLRLIQSAGKASTILEDAFLVVGSLAAAIESKFAPYMQAFLPFLYPALKAYDDTQLCTVAVGIIGDITRAVGDQSAQYASAFVTVLLENLSSEVLNRNVKISILACFGDIALAIGPEFEPYLDTAMTVLRQASLLQPNPLDYDSIDYVTQLREGILDAHTGIVTGFKNTEKVHLLIPYVPAILELVNLILADENSGEPLEKAAFGIVGDLGDAFPNGEIKQYLLQDWLHALLYSKQRYTSDTKKTIRWAREMVKRATA
ncbi:karyopherin Kap95 [Stereum hirsutum FP-91666 SS1]|uniref:Importin-95 n=1 Tax=Stereum hirsutum (strain FP-91666) TaxID=721885 RepID=R7RXQ2_STEHR|nr:karyopherin Kap95 [Stereum hirsutum FP-91666 SS1]EIM80114.1 karyopherin Kap95 [Stereum hirsutum FP-91666 SS1]